MMEQPKVINVCKHILIGWRKVDFLVGHRGRTLAALCFVCEEKFSKDSPLENLTTPIPEVDALKLGIPELVGNPNDEATVYGK